MQANLRSDRRDSRLLSEWTSHLTALLGTGLLGSGLLDSGLLGSGLLGRAAGRIAVPADQLPSIPATWRPVPGSAIVTSAQRYVAYTTPDGLVVAIHSASGLSNEPIGRRIALMTLGQRRVSVHGDDAGRFEARWEHESSGHCLSAAGITLGRFMDILLRLEWPGGPDA